MDPIIKAHSEVWIVLLSSKLSEKLFDIKASELWRDTRRKLYAGITYNTEQPRDRKQRNLMADNMFVRWEFNSVLKDSAVYKAVLFEDLNYNDVWIPRSQLREYDETECVALISRWFWQKISKGG